MVAERLDWHWIFWLNVPIGLIALALGTRLLPESHGAPERLAPVGVTLVSSGVVGLVWALVRANDIAEHEMGKASGVNYMAQRFGAVFSIAIASACSPPMATTATRPP